MHRKAVAGMERQECLGRAGKVMDGKAVLGSATDWQERIALAWSAVVCIAVQRLASAGTAASNARQRMARASSAEGWQERTAAAGRGAERQGAVGHGSHRQGVQRQERTGMYRTATRGTA